MKKQELSAVIKNLAAKLAEYECESVSELVDSAIKEERAATEEVDQKDLYLFGMDLASDAIPQLFHIHYPRGHSKTFMAEAYAALYKGEWKQEPKTAQEERALWEKSNPSGTNLDQEEDLIQRAGYGVKGMKWGAVDAWKHGNPSDAEEIKTIMDQNVEAVNRELRLGEVRTKSSTGGEKGVKPERYDLIPVEPLAEYARLLGRGAEKYADHNWRQGYEFSKSYQALQRHANAWWGGENIDEEMGTSHMAAVVFHANVLMEFEKNHPNFDDRFVATPKERCYRFDKESDAVPCGECLPCLRDPKAVDDQRIAVGAAPSYLDYYIWYGDNLDAVQSYANQYGYSFKSNTDTDGGVMGYIRRPSEHTSRWTLAPSGSYVVRTPGDQLTVYPPEEFLNKYHPKG